jgi:hypothetical protein
MASDDGSGTALTAAVKVPFVTELRTRSPPLSSAIFPDPPMGVGSGIGPIAVPSTYVAKTLFAISRTSCSEVPSSVPPKPAQDDTVGNSLLATQSPELTNTYGLSRLNVSECDPTTTVDEKGEPGVPVSAIAVIVSKLSLNDVPPETQKPSRLACT